jgi:hypothetical protein
MGTSAFAFRIWINETLCPSAMSIFDWSTILPEAMIRSGNEGIYISRMWEEEDVEEERRKQAQAAIIDGIDYGRPAVVWDIYDDEWGLIIGYDTSKKIYNTMSNTGAPCELPFEKLGNNGIDILSVAIPGRVDDYDRDLAILVSLQAAVAHAEQKEWNDRPKYQNGLEAFDLWALIMQKWALLVEAGKSGNIGVDVDNFAKYYAEHYYSARCYARDFLAMIADGDANLQKAAESYADVAGHFKILWEYFSVRHDEHSVDMLVSLADHIKQAGAAEQDAIEAIKKYLA